MSATFSDLRSVITKMRTAGQRPEKISLTFDQMRSVEASIPPTLRGLARADRLTHIIGLPVEIVAGVEDSTLWLQELL